MLSCQDDLYKTFFHGHSYTANPIACAAALASLDLLQQESCMDRIENITASNRQLVHEIIHHPKVMNARSLGTILAFEFHSDKKEYLNKVKEETMQLALQQHVFLRPLGNTVYIMPPYCITAEQLQQVYNTLLLIIDHI